MKTKDNSSEAIGNIASVVAEKLRKTRELTRQTQRESVIQAGGPIAYLKSSYPLLARTASETLSDVEVTRGMPGDMKDAERRLQDCAKCHFGLGICSYDHSGHDRGTQPSFETGRLMFSSCDHWPEYKIRERLESVGVPKRLSAVAITDVWEGLSGAAELKRFATECETGASSLMVGGKRSAEVSVAALRAVISERPSYTIAFGRASDLKMPLKQFYSDPTKYPDPLEELRTATVAVIVDIRRSSSEWFLDAIGEVTYGRFLDNRITIVGLENEDLNDHHDRYFRERVNLCVSS